MAKKGFMVLEDFSVVGSMLEDGVDPAAPRRAGHNVPARADDGKTRPGLLPCCFPLAVGVMVLMGQVGNYEARLLLESTVPTIRFLSSAVMTASSTILALMLTMLALSVNSEADTEAAGRHSAD